MTERLPQLVLVAAAALLLPLLIFTAYSHPFYFSNATLLGGVIALEVLFVAVWSYRQSFFALILLAFLFAGMDLPLGGIWTMARWFFLIIGAIVGFLIMLKEGHGRFRLFHAVSILAVSSALISAVVSRYPSFALLKALSLLLLFVYAGTGARLAAAGRENRFLAGLLTGCEILTVALGGLYFLGTDAMGNPNSLGAVMAVLAPLLLWGTLIDPRHHVHYRRLAIYLLSMYLLFHSHSRAGLAAGLCSCALLCLALRKYKLFAQGVVIFVILVTSAAIFDPEAFSATISSLTTSVVYKDRDITGGVFASRTTPWQHAMDTIHQHFWFGTGFGTTDNGQDANAHLGKFSSSAEATSENGSSYLTILSWVGMTGIVPFCLVLLFLIGKVIRTTLWMFNTGSPFHPAVPIAMVIVSGLLHAAFEDWLFAPGYYVCVFFWSLAFILIDVAPWAPLPSFASSWRPWLMRQRMSSVAPSR